MTAGEAAIGLIAAAVLGVGFIIELDVRKDLTPVFEAVSALDGVLRVTVVDEPAATTT